MSLPLQTVYCQLCFQGPYLSSKSKRYCTRSLTRNKVSSLERNMRDSYCRKLSTPENKVGKGRKCKVRTEVWINSNNNINKKKKPHHKKNKTQLHLQYHVMHTFNLLHETSSAVLHVDH